MGLINLDHISANPLLEKLGDVHKNISNSYCAIMIA